MSNTQPQLGNTPSLLVRSDTNPRPTAPAVLHPSVNAPEESPLAIPPIAIDRMLTTAQASAVLGKDVETLKKWRQRRIGPKYVKYPDGTIRYRLSTIMKFLDDHTVEI